MPARNPTGFDMAQFKAAASPSSAFAKRDPWVRKYDWLLYGWYDRMLTSFQ